MSIAPEIFKATTSAVCPAGDRRSGRRACRLRLTQQLGAARVAVGMDPRPSSAELLDAFVAGAARAGAAVVDFGLVATEMLYYGVAARDLDGGAMVTASHNPPQYNGMKLVGKGALPLSGEEGMPELSSRVLAMGELPAKPATSVASRWTCTRPTSVTCIGSLTCTPSSRTRSSWTPPTASPAGWRPWCFGDSPIKPIEMFFAVDGTFPTTSPTRCLPRTAA